MTHDESSPTDPRERRHDAEAAAELTAALVGEGEAMPAALAARVVAAGRAQVAAARPAARAPRRWVAWGGWAAAAVLAIALALPRQATVPAAPGAADLRAAVLASPRGVRLAWTATPDAAARGAQGDMAWSDTRQQGVMRIVGLAPNEPARWQYQLWIFDAERDARYPVDGGTFDIPAGGGEVLVPVTPRVPVGRATQFAITVERAGGVVVSSRERIVLVAGAE
jgi:hypothetical protein